MAGHELTNDDTKKLSLSSVCNLNTKFNDKCSTDWSKSNLISVVSPDGIYILMPQLDIQRGPFQIELIANPTEPFKHQQCCNIGPPLDTIIHKLDNHQYMQIFMDPALMTHVENRSLDIYPRRFRLAKWSPIINIYPKQCLLATITVDYQLLIFAQTNSIWNVHVDLSFEFDKLWPQLSSHPKEDASKQTKADFNDIRTKLHELSFVYVCWKETKNNGPLLLGATITGDIVVWQVVILEDDVDGKNSEQHLDVKTILRTNLKYITAMQFCDNLLLISAQEGQAVLYDLTAIFYDFEQVDLDLKQNLGSTTAQKTLLIITIPPTVILWNADGIEITDTYMQKITNETIRIVLGKSTNICWCTVNYFKGINGAAPKIEVDDSFSAIDGRDPEVSLHQTPATHVKSAGHNKAVLIADDGSFFQLEFNETRAEASPELTAIRTEHLDLSRMIPRGLCASPNGHLIIMISCVNTMYEPAKIHAPTKVVLVPWLNDKTFFVDCIDKLLDEKWLTNEEIFSPMDVCDRLDYLRSVYPLLSFEHFLELYKSLEAIARHADWPKNGAQLTRLKIVAFLLSKLLEQNNAKMIEENQKIDLNATIYKVIELYNKKLILRTAFSEISRKLSKSTATSNATTTTAKANLLQILTTQQCKSLRNICKWLTTFNEDAAFAEIEAERGLDLENELAAFKEVEDKIENEFCSICQSEIQFEFVRYGVCSNGHRFDRCTRSLLMVDLYSGNDLVCQHCKRHYTTHTIWPTGNKWLCEFCQ